jgi:type IX secretion system substrate protein
VGKNQPLPYMFDSFSVTRVDTTGLLQWKLFAGSAVDSFIIEKGSDPSHFTEMIGSLKGISNITDYQFVDLHLNQGLNYYRIKIVTPSGNFQYSPVRVITYVINTPTLGVFPNPVRNGQLFVNTGTECNRIQLFDILGSLIRSEEKTGLQNTFSVANLSKGVYILKIFTVSGNTVVKILVE